MWLDKVCHQTCPFIFQEALPTRNCQSCFQPKDWLSKEYEIQSHPSCVGLPFLVHWDAGTLGPSTLCATGMTPIVPTSKTDTPSGVFTEKKNLSLKSWNQCLAFALWRIPHQFILHHSATWQLLRQRSVGKWLPWLHWDPAISWSFQPKCWELSIWVLFLRCGTFSEGHHHQNPGIPCFSKVQLLLVNFYIRLYPLARRNPKRIFTIREKGEKWKTMFHVCFAVDLTEAVYTPEHQGWPHQAPSLGTILSILGFPWWLSW